MAYIKLIFYSKNWNSNFDILKVIVVTVCTGKVTAFSEPSDEDFIKMKILRFNEGTFINPYTSYYQATFLPAISVYCAPHSPLNLLSTGVSYRHNMAQAAPEAFMDD